MFNPDTCQLTTKDYSILEVMLERNIGRDEKLTAILRRKITNALVMFRDDIASTVVTLNSRVTYRVDDAPAETRIIAHDEMRGMVGMLLPITNPRGLALLGLGEGQSITVAKSDGSDETLMVVEVAYQPEAAMREAERLGGAAGVLRPRGPVLRIVHSVDTVPDRLTKTHPVVANGGFYDDPGPSAA